MMLCAGTPDKHPVSVAICVATLQRPLGLARLLESLAGMTFREAGLVEDVRVVVVDNDARGTAGPVVRERAVGLPWPVVYDLEPKRGTSHARNRAVQLALQSGADLVAFIDDDEVASPLWLDELIQVQRRYEADVVCGPVLPHYDQGVPRWVIDGRFFERPRRKTGTALSVASTNNVLVARSLLADPGGPFDHRFGPPYALGEDTHLFMRIRRAGGRIVWADDAVVTESVPPTRATARWLLHRAYSAGKSFAQCERSLGVSPRQAARRGVRALGRVARGCLLLAASVPLGRASTVKALRDVWQGTGVLIGLLGGRP